MAAGIVHLSVLIALAAVSREPAAAEPTKAVVIRPDGKPMAGATIYRATRGRHITVDDTGVFQADGKEPVTDRDGSFPLPEVDEPYLLLIMDDDHFALATKEELRADPTVRAKPFARVKGTLRIARGLGANKTIQLFGDISGRAKGCTLLVHRTTTTDEDGHFLLDRVIPTETLRVGRWDPPGTVGWVWDQGMPIDAEPGAITSVELGGKGRPVVGKLVAPPGHDVDFGDRCGVRIVSDRPWLPIPLPLVRDATPPGRFDWGRWYDRWRTTPEARAHHRSYVRVSAEVAPDGTFRIDDVPAGSYRLSAFVNELDQGPPPGPFARSCRSFTIPPIPGGRSDEPFDVGALPVTLRKPPAVGDAAPAFEVRATDGRQWSVADFRGRYLLLDFGAPGGEQSIFQVGRLADLHSKYGDDPRLALLSLVLAADTEETRTFIAAKRQPWPQSIIGPLANPIGDAFGVENSDFPQEVLIGPDGRIVARDFYTNEVKKAIAEALGRPDP